MRDKGICLLSAAALRKAADQKSEMVSQLLFGEMVEIFENHKDWLYIEMLEDGYQGWVSNNQLHILSESDYLSLLNKKRMVTQSLYGRVKTKTSHENAGGNVFQDPVNGLDGSREEDFTVCAGSTFYADEDGRMSIAGIAFEYDGNLIRTDDRRKDLIPEFALQFHSAPYLWGGRSALGLDCSGFTQLVYKMAGINIPRDAAMQAQEGETVHLINEAVPGDLVFFDNEEEVITHVGIILNNDNVIHAHGKVRIDKIDHQGIFNTDKNKYSHNLRIIKRF
jgi:gamma-D-glutamyl-L-lysine dipeptidyl-peptidase